MKVINIIFPFLFILSVSNSLVAQEQNLDHKQGLVAISYDDTEFKRPFTQWTINVLNSDSVRWHGSNDWALRCLGFIESQFSGEITISIDSDHYIRFDFGDDTILEALKKDKSRSIKVIMEKGKKEVPPPEHVVKTLTNFIR